MKRYDDRAWYHFYGLGQPPRGAKEVDWSTFWFTYEAPSPREDSSPPPLAADASDACGQPTQPRHEHGPLPMSCFEDGRECIVRDDNKSIMIHRLDYELIKSQAAQGIIGSKFMLDQESFSVFSGPYPFDNPPSLPEPSDGPAPSNRAADDGRTDADTDLLGLRSDKGDAQEPRRPALPLHHCRQQTDCLPAHASASPSRPTGGIAVAPSCPASAYRTLSGLPRRTHDSSTWTTTDAYDVPGPAALSPFAHGASCVPKTWMILTPIGTIATNAAAVQLIFDIVDANEIKEKGCLACMLVFCLASMFAHMQP
ncbi:unnamed protein product [Symbiodinium natans]|uniref:Uncharacterized protein n=1 Tax=Symbiodinium natans TaxID=878477 RepID=A0A812JD88_9DINO|nr:unnamed protein product [Symbiodinium natans]